MLDSANLAIKRRICLNFPSLRGVAKPQRSNPLDFFIKRRIYKIIKADYDSQNLARKSQNLPFELSLREVALWATSWQSNQNSYIAFASLPRRDEIMAIRRI